MNNFLKVAIVALAILLTTNANAQLLPVSMGVKGGINMSNVSTKGFKSKAGYNAGLTLDLNLPANLAIMTGLELSSKGTKLKGGDLKMDATYLQLPVHMGYRMKLVPGITAHFDLGPYFAQGLWGKTKGTSIIEPGGLIGEKVSYNTFSDSAMKKFDWGLGIGVGVTFIGKIGVRAGYDHGIANIARAGEKVRNRNVYASVGYNFF